MNDYLAYLTRTYSPHAILVYGSFANGTNTRESDFDALVLTDRADAKFDNTTVNGTVLNVFLYPPDIFEKPFEPDDFLQIFDGIILFDRTNTLEHAQKIVRSYIETMPFKSHKECDHDIKWCEKMLCRAARGDAEGDFRRHLLLVESLAIYSELTERFYFGPKKTLAKMETHDPTAFRLYAAALAEQSLEALTEWVAFLAQLHACKASF